MRSDPSPSESWRYVTGQHRRPPPHEYQRHVQRQNLRLAATFILSPKDRFENGLFVFGQPGQMRKTARVVRPAKYPTRGRAAGSRAARSVIKSLIENTMKRWPSVVCRAVRVKASSSTCTAGKFAGDMQPRDDINSKGAPSSPCNAKKGRPKEKAIGPSPLRQRQGHSAQQFQLPRQ